MPTAVKKYFFAQKSILLSLTSAALPLRVPERFRHAEALRSLQSLSDREAPRSLAHGGGSALAMSFLSVQVLTLLTCKARTC